MHKNNILIIDFDSTFVQGETLEQLAELALEGNEEKEAILCHMKEITTKGMEGAISFEESLSKRIRLFQADKKHVAQLAKDLQTKITPSIKENKAFFQKFHKQIYVVSGGFIDYIYPVAKEYSLEKNHILANSFRYNRKGAIVGYDESNPLCRKGGKTEAIKRLHLTQNVYMVGDGYTDYEVRKKKVADTFIAFTENVRREHVVSQADMIVSSFYECIMML